MFDIEDALKALGKKKHRPDETLRRRTVEKLLVSRGAVRRSHTLRWVTASAAAVLLTVVLLFAVPPVTSEACYFTIDINPSIGVKTDAEGIILSVNAQNSDAEALLENLNLIGMPFIDALRSVVATAEEQGYLKDNGHVLVAHFGTAAQVSEEQVETAVSESTHKNVNVLLLQGEESTYQYSGKTHQSAGISLLLKNAQRLGITGTDIDTLIKAVKKNVDGKHNGKTGNGDETTPVPAAEQEQLNGKGNDSSKPAKTDNTSNSEKNGRGDNRNNDDHGSKNENNGNSGNNGNNGYEDNENEENGNGNAQSDDGSHSNKDNHGKDGKG